MLEHRAQDPALDFFYYGFFQALRRFRIFTMTGWMLAGSGVGAVALRWGPVGSGDLISIALCVLLFAGGILIVQGSVVALGAYVRIPFPPPQPGSAEMELPQAVEEILPLLKEVDEGGWQEAFRAMVSLRDIGSRYGLPPPDDFPA